MQISKSIYISEFVRNDPYMLESMGHNINQKNFEQSTLGESFLIGTNCRKKPDWQCGKSPNHSKIAGDYDSLI